jgi:DNA-binding response OmpR family regulator
MNDTSVLVVEDDLCDQRLVRDILDGDGFSTFGVSSGNAALDFLQTELPGLIFLDIMLPGMDGFEILRRIRQFSTVPVIALSASKSLEDREKFVKLGGDDYVTKPYDLDELRFRIMAVLKRTNENHPPAPRNLFDNGFLKIDFDSRRVDADRREVPLPPREYNLLHEFVKHIGKTLTHRYLMTTVWGNEYSSDISLLHTCVARLRSKIEPNPTRPQYLITVSRVGYRFQTTPQ